METEEAKKRRFEARLGKAINRAAEKLPEGWQLTIAIECGSSVALLHDPSGNQIDLDSTGDIVDDIADAISMAVDGE